MVKDMRTPPSKTFNSKLMEAVLESGFIKGGLLLVTYFKSKAAKDRRYLENLGVPVFLFDATSRRHFEEPMINRYNTAFISGMLELIPGTMNKANLIKEALVSLKNARSSCIIVAFKNREVMEKRAEDKGWKKENGRFLPHCEDMDGKQLTICGIDKNEVTDLLGFAGAKSIWEPKITLDGFEFLAASETKK
jgi:hypothetical protein